MTLFPTFLGAYLVLTCTLLFGAFFGDLTAITPPNIGFYSLLSGLAHVLPLFVALRAGIRVNPYVSLAEFALSGRVRYLVELLAQAAGAAAAGGTVFGILYGNPIYTAGVGGTIINTSQGWALFLEAFAGFFIAWVYFTEPERAMLPVAIGALTALAFPFVGPTTHSPFRWLPACIIEGQCGVAGAWIYPVGPLLGVALATLVIYVFGGRKKEARPLAGSLLGEPVRAVLPAAKPRAKNLV